MYDYKINLLFLETNFFLILVLKRDKIEAQKAGNNLIIAYIEDAQEIFTI